MSTKSNFFIRRFHSLVGIIPVGIFLLVHMALNSTALWGDNAYIATIGSMKGIPLVVLAEIGLIAIPILFHGIYGLWVVYVAKNNAFNYTYYRNWAFYLQRITAVITLIFVLFHVYSLRIMLHEPTEIVTTFSRQLQNPLVMAFYIIGVLASFYHFANGIFTFLISWGITIGPKSQDFFSKFSLVFFAVLSILGVGILTKIAGF